MTYPTELVAKAERELQVFERVSQETGKKLLAEVIRHRASQEQAKSGTWVNFALGDITHTDPGDEPGWVRVDVAKPSGGTSLSFVASQILRDMEAQGLMIEWQTALKDALAAQPSGEVVAEVKYNPDQRCLYVDLLAPLLDGTKLYTAPQPAQAARVAMTDEQVLTIAGTSCAIPGSYVYSLVRAVEAHHRIGDISGNGATAPATP